MTEQKNKGNNLGLLNRDIVEMFIPLNYIISPPKDTNGVILVNLNLTWKEVYGLSKNYKAFRSCYDSILIAEEKMAFSYKITSALSKEHTEVIAGFFEGKPELEDGWQKFVKTYNKNNVKGNTHYDFDKFNKEWNTFMLEEADIDDGIGFFKVTIPADRIDKSIPNVHALFDRILFIDETPVKDAT